MRTRIAPTPSGFLHRGNAVNFLLTWQLAQQHGGSVLLRIDDLDPQMSQPVFLDDIFTTLSWLDIACDEGPRTAGELHDVWSQRHRLPLYHPALDELRRQGRVFACSCTRKHVLERSPHGLYPGTCRTAGIDLDAPNVAWRLADDSVTDLPYPVVRQKTGLPSYQIASLVDDTHFGITHIVRGRDLHPSTLVQRRIASILAPNHPFLSVVVYHHPLITDDRGTKLSKSQGAMGVREMIAAGQPPEALIAIATTMANHFGEV
jgi:glutamyl-tRNA synthetase